MAKLGIFIFFFLSLGGDTEGEEGSQNKLEDMIKELSVALTGVKHEQEYMQVFFWAIRYNPADLAQ